MASPVFWGLLCACLFPLCRSSLPTVDMAPRYTVQFPEKGTAIPLAGFPMTLESGERYICEFPSKTMAGTVRPEQEVVQDKTPALRASQALSLLRKSLSRQCFMRLSGWWIYEFCYDKWVRQYHQDNKKSIKTEYHLGYIADAGAAENKPKQVTGGSGAPAQKPVSQELTFGEDSAGPYYATVYPNGTACDLLGTQRSTEVRFYCVATSPHPNHYFTIEEPRTCHYVVSFYTNLVCMLEEFQPPKQDTEFITCHKIPTPVPAEPEPAEVLDPPSDDDDD